MIWWLAKKTYRYLIEYSTNSIFPSFGQRSSLVDFKPFFQSSLEPLLFQSSLEPFLFQSSSKPLYQSASFSLSSNSLSLSTATMLVSMSDVCRMNQVKAWVMDNAYEMERPTRPGDKVSRPLEIEILLNTSDCTIRRSIMKLRADNLHLKLQSVIFLKVFWGSFTRVWKQCEVKIIVY